MQLYIVKTSLPCLNSGVRLRSYLYKIAVLYYNHVVYNEHTEQIIVLIEGLKN